MLQVAQSEIDQTIQEQVQFGFCIRVLVVVFHSYQDDESVLDIDAEDRTESTELVALIGDSIDLGDDGCSLGLCHTKLTTSCWIESNSSSSLPECMKSAFLT